MSMLQSYKGIWPGLPADAKQELDRSAANIEHRRGDKVYREGDEPVNMDF